MVERKVCTVVMYRGESPAFIPVEVPDKSPDLLIKDLEDKHLLAPVESNLLWVTSPSRFNLFTFLFTDWFLRVFNSEDTANKF